MTTIINASSSAGLVQTADTSAILQLQTGSTAAVTINASQNVGIGSSAPTGAKMDVNGGLLVSGALSANQTDKLYLEYGSNIATLGSYGNTASSGIVRIATGGGGGSGGQERMRIDSSGNVGIGTSSPTQQLNFTGNALTSGWYRGGAGTAANPTFTVDGNTGMYRASSGDIAFSTSNAERMRIDSSGNVGIGNTAPADRLQIEKASANCLLSVARTTGGAGGRLVMQHTDSVGALQTTAAVPLTFGTNDIERMRITSAGALCFGTTTPYDVGVPATINASVTNLVLAVTNGGATPYGQKVVYTAASPNSSGYEFFRCDDSTTTRMTVRSNGGIANYSANNSNLSDQREKKDIELAGNYLDKICAIPVKTFLYNDQTDTDLNLGVIAQDVQAVAPELVNESNWADKNEPEKLRLSIYQTDLQYALMKAIQELKAEVDSLKAQINGA